MKINWSKNTPKEAGQYLCKFPSSNGVQLCTVYHRPAEYMGNIKFGDYLAIYEWGHKNVDRGYNCLWSEKIES